MKKINVDNEKDFFLRPKNFAELAKNENVYMVRNNTISNKIAVNDFCNEFSEINIKSTIIRQTIDEYQNLREEILDKNENSLFIFVDYVTPTDLYTSENGRINTANVFEVTREINLVSLSECLISKNPSRYRLGSPVF